MEHLAEKSPVCCVNIMMRVAPASLREPRVWDIIARGEPSLRKSGRKPAFRYAVPPLPVVGIDSSPGQRHPLGHSGRMYMLLSLLSLPCLHSVQRMVLIVTRCVPWYSLFVLLRSSDSFAVSVEFVQARALFLVRWSVVHRRRL